MADTKISDLAAASALSGTETLPVVQGGTTKKATVANIVSAGSATYATTPTPGTPREAVVTSGPDQIAATNLLWLGTHLFRGDDGTGTAVDFGGTIDAAGAGGSKYRVPLVLVAEDGTNGARGDSIASDAANDVGATSFNGFYSSTVFDDKGSLNLNVVFGTMSPYSGGGDVYGELAAFVSSLTNNRTGALVEGFEAAVNSGTAGAPVQGRNAGMVAVLNEHNASITYWNRGFWAASGGSQAAGDAFYAGGGSGWRNFLHMTHTDGTDRFRVDSTGKIIFGAGGASIEASGSNVYAVGTFVADEVYSGGALYGTGYFYSTDSSRSHRWGAGSPEGVVPAAVGSTWGRTDGGAGTSFYVKESGAGNTGWVAK